MTNGPQGKLMDSRRIQEELGIKRAPAEAIMRQLPKVTIEGSRKIYVRRADVDRYLDEHTEAA